MRRRTGSGTRHLAGILASGTELAAAIDRERPKRIRQVLFGMAGGGPGAPPGHHAPAARAGGLVLLERLAVPGPAWCMAGTEVPVPSRALPQDPEPPLAEAGVWLPHRADRGCRGRDLVDSPAAK